MLRFAGIVVALLCFLPGVSAAQRPVPSGPPTGAGRNPNAPVFEPKAGRLVVRVRTRNGAPLAGNAMVRVYSSMTGLEKIVSVTATGEAEIRSIPIGEYRIEVRAPGFKPFEDRLTVWLPEAANYAHVVLLPETGEGTVPPAGPPLLAPKAQKEMEKAMAALEENDLKEARKRLEKLEQMAPGHPDVHYLLGILYMKLSELEKARAYLDRALQLQPDHASALLALAGLHYNRREFRAAMPLFERALVLQPGNWEAQWMLASACFQEREFAKARAHAELALADSGENAPHVLLLLARTHAQLGERERAVARLRELFRRHESHPAAEPARRLLETLERPQPAAAAVPEKLHAPASQPRAAIPVQPEVEPRSWAPPGIDDKRPATTPGVSCSLREVLRGVRRRSTELVRNLERFTATEEVRFEQLDEFGRGRYHMQREWEYLVSVRQTRPGTFSVEETRNPDVSPREWPSQMMTRGLSALALVFHPFYLEDFQMACEGLGSWQGSPAWLVRFEQRKDRTPRFRSFRSGGNVWPILLKGRAWIAANSFHVLRLESNLLEPLTEAGLEHEHLIINYAPVHFRERNVELWLPSVADFYVLYKGRRYHYRHSFRDYLLFSVDVGEQIIAPTPEAGKDTVPQPPVQ